MMPIPSQQAVQPTAVISANPFQQPLPPAPPLESHHRPVVMGLLVVDAIHTSFAIFHFLIKVIEAFFALAIIKLRPNESSILVFYTVIQLVLFIMHAVAAHRTRRLWKATDLVFLQTAFGLIQMAASWKCINSALVTFILIFSVISFLLQLWEVQLSLEIMLGLSGSQILLSMCIRIVSVYFVDGLQNEPGRFLYNQWPQQAGYSVNAPDQNTVNPFLPNKSQVYPQTV